MIAYQFIADIVYANESQLQFRDQCGGRLTTKYWVWKDIKLQVVDAENFEIYGRKGKLVHIGLESKMLSYID